MLSIEDKIKCVEKFSPVGFEILGQPKDLFYDLYRVKSLSLKIKEAIESQFISRVIEAINRIDDLDMHIVLTKLYAEVLDWEYNCLDRFPIDSINKSDVGKTEAIKYILSNIE